MVISLRPYQQSTIDAVFDSYEKGVKKVGIVLPTGGGKTIAFASLIDQFCKKTKKKALIIAHREELLQQAQEKLYQVAPNLTSSIEQGENKADLRADVIIASVATLGRADSERIKKFNPEDFSLIVVDEFHHSASASYRNVLKYFHTLKKVDDDNKRLLLGVSATAFRSDNLDLQDIIDKIVYEYDLVTAIKQKYLSNLRAYTIKTNIDISQVKKSGGDFNITDLGKAINRDSRNKIILETYNNYCKGQKTLIFAVDVQHAIDLTNVFKLANIQAEYVIGSTEKEKRKKIIIDFSTGNLSVLIGVGVFTEGFDAPCIKNVIMARPTQSLGLYYQMIGRATRLFEGKTHATIYDVVDNTGKQGIRTMASLLGIEGKLDFKGKDLIEIKNFVEKLRNLSPNILWDQVDVNNPAGEVKRLDLIAGLCVPKELSILTDFAWSKLATGRYKIALGKDESQAFSYNMYLRENALGQYEIYLTTFKKEERKTTWVKLDEGLPLEKAVGVADKKIRDSFSNRFGLIKRNAPWRAQEPTEKQLKMLTKLGVQESTLKQIDKGQASFLLDKLFEEKPKKELSLKQRAYLRWKGKF